MQYQLCLFHLVFKREQRFAHIEITQFATLARTFIYSSCPTCVRSLRPDKICWKHCAEMMLSRDSTAKRSGQSRSRRPSQAESSSNYTRSYKCYAQSHEATRHDSSLPKPRLLISSRQRGAADIT
jgi:hypothetical protein